MGSIQQGRNNALDVFKGLAVVLMVLSNTHALLSGSIDYSNGFPFRIYFDMFIAPMFVFAVGYVMASPSRTVGRVWSRFGITIIAAIAFGIMLDLLVSEFFYSILFPLASIILIVGLIARFKHAEKIYLHAIPVIMLITTLEYYWQPYIPEPYLYMFSMVRDIDMFAHGAWAAPITPLLAIAFFAAWLSFKQDIVWVVLELIKLFVLAMVLSLWTQPVEFVESYIMTALWEVTIIMVTTVIYAACHLLSMSTHLQPVQKQLQWLGQRVLFIYFIHHIVIFMYCAGFNDGHLFKYSLTDNYSAAPENPLLVMLIVLIVSVLITYSYKECHDCAVKESLRDSRSR